MEPNSRLFHGQAVETPGMSPENKHKERRNSFCESHPGPVLKTGELPEESKDDQQNLRPAEKREWGGPRGQSLMQSVRGSHQPSVRRSWALISAHCSLEMFEPVNLTPECI